MLGNNGLCNYDLGGGGGSSRDRVMWRGLGGFRGRLHASWYSAVKCEMLEVVLQM